MGKNAKVALGIIIGIVVLCLCLCVGGYIFLQITGRALQESVILNNPEEAQSLAHSMLDYDLPPGYQESAAFNMGIMKMVMIDDPSTSSRPLIMIAEVPTGGAYDEEEMRRQLELSMQRSMGNRNFNVQLVDEQTRTIREQEVTLLIFEGTDSTGTQIRQIVSEIFEGKNGLVMLMVVGSEIQWNQAELDAFINSIR